MSRVRRVAEECEIDMRMTACGARKQTMPAMNTAASRFSYGVAVTVRCSSSTLPGQRVNARFFSGGSSGCATPVSGIKRSRPGGRASNRRGLPGALGPGASDAGEEN